MSVTVEVATAVDDELVAAFANLIPQLSRSNPAPDRAHLDQIVRSEAATLLVARRDGAIVGTLTLVMFRIPTGVRAIIEDVVVDEAARGGERPRAGELLTTEAIRIAREAGAVSVDLTSRPSRVAANKVYQRLGFELRETNVYRYTLS